jgi:hypothetical protein
MSNDNGFRPTVEQEIRRLAEQDQTEAFKQRIFEEEGQAIIRGVAGAEIFLFSTAPPGQYTVQLALALGAALVLGKKIVVMNFADREPPPLVAEIADASFRMKNNPLTEKGKAEFERKYAKVLTKLGEE